MRLSEPEPELEVVAPRIFATTHWSVVLAAGGTASEPSRRALETLCHDYWYPIYVYVRRKGYGPDDAQDLTQEFFTQLIAKQHLRLADRNKGRFRSFLLATLHFFLAREWSRAHRQKRGGQFKFVSLDQDSPEERYQMEPADNQTPEKQFQRQWALTVLKQSMNALESECSAAGKANLFCEVKQLLSGERDGATYATIGARLSMTETAVRVAVHRLRQRYGELLRAEIAQTVDSEDEVEEELRQLLHALGD
jgi:RNA polymerase sigma-70 factor (ECF subfamily)